MHETQCGPLRVHRMKWKVRFRELTGWRSKNDEERTKNVEERLKIFAKIPTETLRKRLGTNFLHGTNFFHKFQVILELPGGMNKKNSSLLPLFIEKWGRCLPPSSPRRARWLPPEATAFWRAQVGLVAICTPTFIKYTPAFFFVILFS